MHGFILKTQLLQQALVSNSNDQHTVHANANAYDTVLYSTPEYMLNVKASRRQ
jgi:hypothetical protein